MIWEYGRGGVGEVNVATIGHSLAKETNPPQAKGWDCLSLLTKVQNYSRIPHTACYWQPENLNDAMRVLQLKEPEVFRYSLVNQKVQSSTGSTVMAL